ncbi:MAG TPA: carbohydrate ABC transporter permease [Spirochaetia bacterium]|nr:carbohydrate ABC transporter permease [Spirochaetia bacterium]
MAIAGAHRNWPMQVVKMLFLFVVGVLLLYPFFWLISSSLKPTAEVFTPGKIELLPRIVVWKNYVDGWFSVRPYTFGRFYLNSLLLVASGVLGTLFTCSLAGYAFARLRFPGRNKIFLILLATLMLPYQVTLIPQYIMWAKMGFVGTYIPLIFPYFTAPAYYTFFMRQFMTSIPYDLDESAVIDGASRFMIYRKIILPLSKPVAFTVFLFVFGEIYSDFLGPLIYLNNVAKYTVALALNANIDNEGVVNWAPILSMTFVSMIPSILVFLVAQKNLREGIALSGLKA